MRHSTESDLGHNERLVDDSAYLLCKHRKSLIGCRMFRNPSGVLRMGHSCPRFIAQKKEGNQSVLLYFFLLNGHIILTIRSTLTEVALRFNSGLSWLCCSY